MCSLHSLLHRLQLLPGGIMRFLHSLLQLLHIHVYLTLLPILKRLWRGSYIKVAGTFFLGLWLTRMPLWVDPDTCPKFRLTVYITVNSIHQSAIIALYLTITGRPTGSCPGLLYSQHFTNLTKELSVKVTALISKDLERILELNGEPWEKSSIAALAITSVVCEGSSTPYWRSRLGITNPRK